MKLQNMHDLLVDQLRDLYSAENQLVKALPQMVEAASDSELKQALEDHLTVTQNQVDRLEQIFEGIDQSPKGEVCEGMNGLLKEGKRVLKEKGTDEVKDAALIAAAQRVEHYEIAGYGCAATYAKLLDMDDAQNLLHESLEEEKAADEELNRIADSIHQKIPDVDVEKTGGPPPTGLIEDEEED